MSADLPPVERLRTRLRTDDVEYLATHPRAVLVGGDAPEELRPRSIIRIGGQYLVETADEPDTWLMGQLQGDLIVCWGSYGSLDTALRSL
jgi:hypothetical protein